MKKIFYTKPSITSLEIKYVSDAITNGWGENCYGYINQLENNFKEYLGVKHAIATSSCTGALMMGMYALGIGQGDEVILADTNWVASVSPIIHLGANPVYCDIEPDSWCIKIDDIERLISKKTKAILAVHLYGNLCNLSKLIEISNKYNIPIIEDSAEAIGSIYHGKKAGSTGKFGAFSFHGTKTLTTGEGGMFVTNDSDLYERVLTLSNHGRSRLQVKQFWPDEVGFKFKMSNLQAALGCAQLERSEDLISRRREIFFRYKANLKSCNLNMNPENEDCKNGFWMPTICSQSDKFDSNLLREALIKNNIDARVVFWPLSSTGIKGNRPLRKDTYFSDAFPKLALNLPCYYDLEDEDVDKISSIIREFF